VATATQTLVVFIYNFVFLHVCLIILAVLLMFVEKFFDMSEQHCKEALQIYKKFIATMDRVRMFFRVAQVRDGRLLVVTVLPHEQLC